MKARIKKDLFLISFVFLFIVFTVVNYFFNSNMNRVRSINKLSFSDIKIESMEENNIEVISNIVKNSDITIFLPINYCSSCESELIGLINYINNEANISIILPHLEGANYNKRKIWLSQFDNNFVKGYILENVETINLHFKNNSVLVMWKDCTVSSDNIIAPEEFMRIYDKFCEMNI